MAVDGSLNFDTQIDETGFNRGTARITSSVRGLGKLLALTFGVIGVGALIKFGREAVEIASDLEEVQNVVDTVFGEMSKDIDDFSKTAIDKFGLSELSAKQFASTMGAMLKPSKLATQQIASMSKVLTGASGGMASFFNKTSDLVQQDLASYFAGSSETMLKYGLNAQIGALESYNLSKGITKAWKSMSEAERQLTRYNFLVENLGYTFNDFEKTQDSYANQTRILSERWKEFLGIIGTQLIQVLNPAIKILNTLLVSLTKATKGFIAFYSAVTGQQIEQTSKISDSIADSEENQAGLTKEVKKTNKELKGTLASFDEVNILQKKTTEEAGAGIELSVPTAQKTEIKVDTKAVGEELEISPNIQRIIDLLQPLRDIDFTPLKESFENLKLSLEGLNNITLERLGFIYTDILVPLATWTIEDFIPAFLETLASAITLLVPILESFKPLASWLWIEFLQPLSTFAGNLIVETLNLLTKALTSLSEWATENQGIINGITTTLVIFFALWKITELLAFIEISGGLVLAFTSLATAIWATVTAKLADKAETIALNLLYAKDFIVSIAKTIVKIGLQTIAYIANKLAILAVKTQTLAFILVQKVQLVKAMILSAIQIAKNTVVLIAQKIALIASKIAQIAMNVATLAWNVICAIATTVTTAFGVAVAFLTSPVGLVILAIVALIAIIVLLYKNWDKVKEIAGIVWEYIKKKWSQFSNWIKENVTDPVAKFFKKLWDGIKESFTKTFDSIKTAFKIIVNTYIGIWEGFFNLVIKGINFLINKLNAVKFDIPEWMGGGKFGFDIGNIGKINIPRLATGAVIPPNSEFLAVLGDQKSGTNIETPLATMVEAFKMAMGENGGNGDVTINFTGSLAQLGKVLKPVIDKEGQRQGRSKVVTGGAF